MVERKGEIVAQSTTILGYRSNSSLGTLSKPVELNFVTKGSNITIYPNPFLHTTTISVDLRGYPTTSDHQVQVSIVDVAGRMVLQIPAKKVAGTGMSIAWNGRDAAGNNVSNGVYFISVTIDGVPASYKVVKQ
jgi:flagellar hook assembly protein FlgD